METKSLFAVSDLLKNNMDGFMKVFFESNLNIEELDDWNNSSVSLELKLFNEKGQSLYTLVIGWEDFKNLKCADDYKFESSMCVITGIESYDFQKKLEFKLFFPDSDFSCGECYIFEYEETQEEEEFDKKPVEVVKEQKIPKSKDQLLR